MITVRTHEQAEALRSRLIERIWGDAGVSVRSPQQPPLRNSAESAARNRTCAASRPARHLDERRLCVVRLLLPSRKRHGQLTLFHQGHSNDLGNAGSAQAIEQLLSRGHSVMALYLPTFGPNTAPVSYDTLQQT